MKYEGDAVQYTAFALVSIESVWPNPDGNELSPDDADLDLIDATLAPNKTDARPSFGVSQESSSGVETERDYHDHQGYYKILPLNVTNVRTSTSLNGSSFTVSFTLDDLLLVTDSENESAFRYATGIPISANDLVESELEGALPMLINTNKENVSWKYVKDEELGLSRYRVSGASSMFNIEDLVDVNDTVTIWIYHDPQDFYFKDELPTEEDGFFDEDGKLLRFNDTINSVIGSGDRRNQFFTDKKSFDETLLGNLGIINEFMSTSIEELLVAGFDEEEIDSQVPKVSQENIFNLLNSFYTGASSGGLPIVARNQLRASVLAAFPPETTSETSRNRILGLMETFSIPSSLVSHVMEDGEIRETDIRVNVMRSGREGIRRLIQLLKPDESGTFLFNPSMDPVSYTTNERFNLLQEAQKFGLTNTDEISEFVFSLNLFAKELDKMSTRYVRQYLSRQSIARSRQAFVNGRTALINQAHGETPYLALKGTISSVEANVGTSEGTYLVTISGKGYEKVLHENEVYYEDFLYPSGSLTAQTDYHSIYVNMSPPRAIQHIVARWASKQVLLGKPTTWSQAALNRYIYIDQLLTEDEDEENENNERVKDTSRRLLDEDIPIRGNFILSEFTIEPRIENVRLFSPLNYLDTTRIQEMVRALDKSYEVPELETAINTAVEMDTRRSVWENIRKVGGIANFYQMFVDESGRLRYRLSFEAMERTPTPEYTPTIQDYDVLSEGNSFSIDDSQLVTIVEVKPIVGQHNVHFMDLGFIGRNVPEKGKVPLLELDIPEETVSPELFRYGFRSLRVQDIYQSETEGAKRKASLYRGFFGQPLKRATLKVRNNTSYRVGETVLVSLQRNKKRSRALIDLNRWVSWLEYLLGDDELLRMYVGVDGRLLETGKNSFVLTSGDGYVLFDSPVLYREFNQEPHRFVAEQFLNTFKFMQSSLPGVNVLTPEYFPSVYWYYASGASGGAYGWDENKIDSEVIVEAYEYALKASAMGDSEAAGKLQELLTHGDAVFETLALDAQGNPLESRNDFFKVGLINNLKFQDFRVASYFIDAVSHNFAYGADATTTLSLNYGQDTLALLDPVTFIPFGFISLEKKLRIGYEGSTQENLWQEYPSTLSAIQRMYKEQFLEDETYKKASFLHASQFLRNSSNFMYEIATVREGLDASLDWSIQENRGTLEPIEREFGTSIQTSQLVNSNRDRVEGSEYSESTRRMIRILGFSLSGPSIRMAESQGNLDRYLEEFAAGTEEVTRTNVINFVSRKLGISE